MSQVIVATGIRRPARREAGFVLPATIVLLVVLSLVILSLMVANRSTSESRGKRLNVAYLDAAAQSGFDRYRQALESQRVTAANGYRPTTAQWNNMLSTSTALDERVIRTDQLAPAFAAQGLRSTGGGLLAGAEANTMRWRISAPRTEEGAGKASTLYGYFSPVAIVPPGPGRPSLTIYAKVWYAPLDESRAIDYRLERMTLRPTSFADYQIVTDGPLSITGGSVSAPVFSNGFADSYLDTSLGGATRIQTTGGVGCSGNASFTTASPGTTISAGGPCGGAQFAKRAATGEYISLQRARNQLRTISTGCTGGTVRCYTSGASHSVVLGGSNALVDGSVNVSLSSPTVLYFTAPTRVSGAISGGGVTIAVANAGITLGGGGVVGVANGQVASGNAAVGLLTDSNIEADISPGNCPSGVNAAVASGSGGLTIPAEYRTPFATGALRNCGGGSVFSVQASLATHRSPLMRTDPSGASTFAGYARATYSYAPGLQKFAPPSWPTTDGGWSVVNHGAGNLDCLTAANLTLAACA